MIRKVLQILWRTLGRMSMPCHEQNLDLPANDAATCWWLSSNLTLFHKQRPELDLLFETYAKYESIVKEVLKNYNTPPSTDLYIMKEGLWNIFKNIYDFYTNKKQFTHEDLIGFRLDPEMKIFNTDDFKVDGSSFQDAHEYILKLLNYINIPSQYMISASSEVRTEELLIWDLYMVTKVFGLEGEQGNKQIDYFQCNKNTNTILVNMNRSNPASKTVPVKTPLAILEKISVNLINTDMNVSITPLPKDIITPLLQETDFELDAILCATDGHYFAYVKCSGSEEWLAYNAMSKGKLTTSFVDFEDMMRKEKDLPIQATLLFYSRLS